MQLEGLVQQSEASLHHIRRQVEVTVEQVGVMELEILEVPAQWVGNLLLVLSKDVRSLLLIIQF